MIKLILFAIFVSVLVVAYIKTKKKKNLAPIVEVPEKIEIAPTETPIEVVETPVVATPEVVAPQPIEPVIEQPIKKRKYNKKKSTKKTAEK